MRTVRYLVLVALVLGILMVASGACGGGIRERRPNLIAGEFCGRSLLLGAGYEHFLTNRVGLGVGFGFYPALDFGGIGDCEQALTFPICLSLVPIGETHSLYLSCGVAYMHVGEHSGPAALLSSGYQFQSEHGLLVRLLVTMYTGSGDLLREPRGGANAVIAILGIAVGRAF
jgi:hypothetical protein